MANDTIFDLLNFDPDSANAGQGEITRGSAYLRLEKYTEAFEVFDALSKAHPELVSAWANTHAPTLKLKQADLQSVKEGGLEKQLFVRDAPCR